jgi:hypothetical protein
MSGRPSGAPTHVLRGKDSRRGGRNPVPMPDVEISRTLVKSPPELWAELERERLGEAVGATKIHAAEPERELAWEAPHGSGSARLEPTSWGTKVTLSADLERQVARHGLFARIRGRPAPQVPTPEELERRLERLLDDLGQAHRKPFTRDQQ